ncbi:hypothetical protein N7494_005378 [Penicillium frequentans]|uniref:FAD-binding PCMH-type domain-containing protein n=1 Tax=Penicillium frequentans TaxID=3151616 RepID=A0AAD6GGZ2_9EURO|nr:hypothetical protein N7494_005378 [Penicillium glabrum]
MYGMKPKKQFIEKALEMLVEQPEGGMVVVFHRDETLHLDGLVCHQTASFPSGAICVTDDDDVLDVFAPFIAGSSIEDVEAKRGIQAEWRTLCRALSRREKAHPNQLSFSSPNIMVAFTKHATAITELTAQVPLSKGDRVVKNREAHLRQPASVVRPKNIQQIQKCVQWALKHGLGLSIVGGGHSGHCQWPNVVAVDMGAFDQLHILPASDDGERCSSGSGPLVVAGAGCKTGDIIRRTMAAGLTVPLGARPSVGAGLWLQGGIGHLARLYGLACDSIVGAVVVSVANSQVICIGYVPSENRPAGAVRPTNETDQLWAIKGAGTNFCIVVSVTFRAFVAPTYLTRNWIFSLSDQHDARLRLENFDTHVARKLPHSCSVDAYLYWDAGQLHLGITAFESFTSELATQSPMSTISASTCLGPEEKCDIVDSVKLFEAEMYISRMHGGHGRGKTSSFKRCLFLKNIGAVADVLIAAMETRPTPFCYLHLLQGGGAVRNVAANATAFGCRDWDFACVITGVWRRDQDQTELARTVVGWVYKVAQNLLPLSTGVYSADLGPDPRDHALAIKAFGANGPQLARLKYTLDPHNVLAYACPLQRAPMGQKLIVLVTGRSCAGKDHCAGIWVSVFTSCSHRSLTARTVSISDVIKREYAVATGADFDRLLRDRAYKEQHRSSLTRFFHDQVQRRPQLPMEHFINAVNSASDVDVLIITGMRDLAPVSVFSPLVPESRLLDVHIRVSEKTRQYRRRCHGAGNYDNEGETDNNDSNSNLAVLDYCPSLIFDNDMSGNDAARIFAEQRLLPFFDEDLQCLKNMIRPVPDFPRPGIDFRHVLNISQQPGGLTLCTSLLQAHFAGDWVHVGAIACCEASGFVFASPLAVRVDIPLALIRQAGKLPPPTVSVLKSTSHISSPISSPSNVNGIEMDRYLIPGDASVVVVDDVLATGKTLLAVLQLLEKANVRRENIRIMVVAEFPIHHGRELLHRHGFGGVPVQSLLIFDGA